MQSTLKSSESLLASLCKEVQGIRNRCTYIIDSIVHCNDNNLLLRLKSELNHLQKRRVELLETAKSLKKLNLQDDIAIDFLIEISNRPYIYK